MTHPKMKMTILTLTTLTTNKVCATLEKVE
jgi:hypothetical protein